MTSLLPHTAIHQPISGLTVALFQLMLAGYDILHVNTKQDRHCPSIEINKPLDTNEPITHQTIAEKQFGQTVQWGCRIYWRLTG